MPALIVAGLALLFILWLLGQPYWTRRQRDKLRAQPFPDAWRDILMQRVPYVRALPADLQRQLEQHIQVFVAEKAFIGCAGLVMTDEMRITIAAQACLLLLNRPRGYYPNLRQILVYPGGFVVQRAQTDDSGVAHHAREALSGESWSQGQVILSWHDALEGAAMPHDGQNVVIHEFAHQLDQETAPRCWQGATNTPAGRRCSEPSLRNCRRAARTAKPPCSATTAPPTRLNFSPSSPKSSLSNRNAWPPSTRRSTANSPCCTASIR